MPPEKAERRERENVDFLEAWVEAGEPLIGGMANDPGDRHVLAAAVAAGVERMVSDNWRHFPPTSSSQWHVEVIGPSAFRRELHHWKIEGGSGGRPRGALAPRVARPGEEAAEEIACCGVRYRMGDLPRALIRS